MPYYDDKLPRLSFSLARASRENYNLECETEGEVKLLINGHIVCRIANVMKKGGSIVFLTQKSRRTNALLTSVSIHTFGHVIFKSITVLGNRTVVKIGFSFFLCDTVFFFFHSKFPLTCSAAHSSLFLSVLLVIIFFFVLCIAGNNADGIKRDLVSKRPLRWIDNVANWIILIQTYYLKGHLCGWFGFSIFLDSYLISPRYESVSCIN